MSERSTSELRPAPTHTHNREKPHTHLQGETTHPLTGRNHTPTYREKPHTHLQGETTHPLTGRMRPTGRNHTTTYREDE